MLSFAKDIRPLFTDVDVEHMKDVDADFDLSDYDSVKDRATDILNSLTDGSMPPGQPWPDSDITTFKQWITDGFPS